jgi:hypothetical protein
VDFAESLQCRSLAADRPPQQLPDICHVYCLGRVADRPRLSSWGAGRGADLVWGGRLGGASVGGVPLRRWSWCQRGPSAPRGVSRIGCAWRWLVVRGRLGRRFALSASTAGDPGRLMSLYGTPNDPGHEIAGPGRLVVNYSPRNGPDLRARDAGRFERHLDVENAPDHRAAGPGRLAPQMRGVGDTDRAMLRWRRGRVGRAVIRDVAIRANARPSPHKQNPQPRPPTSSHAPNHESVVAISRSADHPATPRGTPHRGARTPSFGRRGKKPDVRAMYSA